MQGMFAACVFFLFFSFPYPLGSLLAELDRGPGLQRPAGHIPTGEQSYRTKEGLVSWRIA
jgi:hypothetical protein